MSNDKILKARELVLDYIATHNISDKLNKAVNEVCRSRPKDPWLFLSDIVSDWTKDVPLIDRLVAKQGIDTNGNPSLQLQLYGKVSSAHSRPPRYLGVQDVFMVTGPSTLNSKDDSKENGDRDPFSECKMIMNKVSEFLSPALRSIRIDEQNRIDNELIKMYSDLQDIEYHLIPAISTLIATTSSNASHLPMYQYLTRIRRRLVGQRKDADHLDDDAVDHRLPNLCVQITASSSNRDPAVHIIPKSTLKAMDRVRTINEVAIAILDKVPSSTSSEKGGVVMMEDTDCNDLEGLLTMIGNVVSDKEVSLCLSFSSNPTSMQFDGENGKYRINGAECDSKGVITYFEKLIDSHPEIEYLEDPLHESDTETSALLTAKMRAKKVTVIGSQMYCVEDKELIQSVESGMQSEQSSAVMVSTSSLFTMSSALKIANMMQQFEGKAVLMVSDHDFVANGIASHAVDLATACNASLVRLPAPNGGGEGVKEQYNRWLMIADDLAVDMDDLNDDNLDLANGGPVERESTEFDLANGRTATGTEKTEDLP